MKKKPDVWNYELRVLYKKEGTYNIHIVYIRNNKPAAYSMDPLTLDSRSPEELKWQLTQMQRAFEKPILMHGDKFPRIHKPKK